MTFFHSISSRSGYHKLRNTLYKMGRVFIIKDTVKLKVIERNTINQFHDNFSQMLPFTLSLCNLMRKIPISLRSFTIVNIIKHMSYSNKITRETYTFLSAPIWWDPNEKSYLTSLPSYSTLRMIYSSIDRATEQPRCCNHRDTYLSADNFVLKHRRELSIGASR